MKLFKSFPSKKKKLNKPWCTQPGCYELRKKDSIFCKYHGGNNKGVTK